MGETSQSSPDHASQGRKPLVAAAVVLGLGVAFGLRQADHTTRAQTPPKAPEKLVADPGPCRYARAAAADQAARAERLARAKAERYAFDPSDGIEGMRLWSRATRCFELAGQGTDAARAQAGHRALQARILADYRDHRLRLSFALERGWRPRAREEARVVRHFLALAPGPYRDWLDRIIARLERGTQPER